MKTCKAPWSVSLIVVSTLATLLCAGSTIGMIWSSRGISPWLAPVPMVLICVAALFTIRGYTVTPDALIVHRLFWATRLPLAGLQSVRSMPDAMRWSLRTFGNGGLFSFTGFYRNKALGPYRAFVTDPHRTVVLQFPTRTIVVSPSVPEDLVHDLGERIPAG